eukprot:TRINITY_DN10708_c0_g1_i1.p1 TRINITY_DN10708_c0_g1~~TRINITY_DN10708_c0_g1_i1.p1  ORF type:complete len:903 (-),score=237.68 TRINITY_DN10708_c0_g1_i1:31-2739(-)
MPGSDSQLAVASAAASVIATNPSKAQSALDPSELEFIIAHLRYGDDNSQYHAAHTLATMAVVPVNRPHIGAANAVNALATLLTSENPRMRGLVLSAMANLALDDEIGVKVVQIAGLKVLNDVPRGVGEDPMVQYHTARLWANLTHFERNRLKCAQSCDSVAAMHDLLKSENIAVQREAATAIANVTTLESGVEHVLHIQDMISTLVTHLSSQYMEVQQRVMRAVANIAVNEKAKKALLELGAVAPLVDGLLSGITQVQHAAVCALAQLAGDDDANQVIVGANAIDALMAAIDTQLPDLQSGAATALARIAVTPVCVEKLASLGGLQLLAALSLMPDPRIQSSAAAALANVALFEPLGTEMMECGAYDSLLSLLKSWDNGVTLAATRAIANLSCSALLRPQLAGAAPTLVELAASVETTEIQKEALWAIANLCMEEPLRKALVKAGCVEPTIRGLQTNDKEYQFIALKIIAALSEAEDMRFMLLKSTVMKDVMHILHSMQIPADMRALCVSIARWFSETESSHEHLLKHGSGRILLPLALDEKAEKQTRDDALAACANMMGQPTMRDLAARPTTLQQLISRSNVGDEACQFHTLKIITELATDQDPTHTSILRTVEGIQFAIRMAEVPNSHVKTKALAFLGAISENEPLRVIAIDHGVVNVLVTAIGSGDTHILTTALHALARLGINEEARNALVAASAIYPVMLCIVSNDAEMRLHGGKALSALCGVEPEPGLPGLWQLRAIPQTTFTNVMQSAVAALLELLKDETIRARVVSFGGFEPLVRLVQSTLTAVRLATINILKLLSDSDNGVLQVLGAGAVPALLHAISNKKTDSDTLLTALDALGKIAANERWSGQLPRFGTVEVMEVVLQHPSERARKAAQYVLDCLRGAARDGRSQLSGYSR